MQQTSQHWFYRKLRNFFFFFFCSKAKVSLNSTKRIFQEKRYGLLIFKPLWCNFIFQNHHICTKITLKRESFTMHQLLIRPASFNRKSNTIYLFYNIIYGQPHIPIPRKVKQLFKSVYVKQLQKKIMYINSATKDLDATFFSISCRNVTFILYVI